MLPNMIEIILGYMQFRGGAAACFDSQIPSLCFTIALIALTAAGARPPPSSRAAGARPPPSSRALHICNFHLILGSAVLLSSAVPNTLRWLPYLSCIRPFFHLLPLPFQRRILGFPLSIWDAIKCYVCSLFDKLPERFRLCIRQYSQSGWDAIRELLTVDTSCPDSQASGPEEANLDLELGNRDGSTSLAPSNA